MEMLFNKRGYLKMEVLLPFTLILLSFSSYAQINLPQIPQPATLQSIDFNTSIIPVAPVNQNSALISYQQNAIREQQQREQRWQYQSEASADFNRQNKYELPSCDNKQGAMLYRQAFRKLQEIIQSDSISLKTAIFIVENAFLEEKLNFEAFDQYMKACIKICEWKLHKDGYKDDNQLAKIYVLYQFFSDTIKYKDQKIKQWKIHYPFSYDFDDWEGRNDYSKMFVSKLMATHAGQCHSLPLLFLILAEEWNLEAFLSFSPNHYFVRFKDANGNLRNIELTNRELTTDSWVTGSGYVKAEALKSKIYLDTLSKRKIVAQCFVDLAHGYKTKFCYDKFLLQCANQSIKYFPNDIYAQQIKSDYYTLLFNHVVNKIGRPPIADLPKYSKAYEIYKTRNQLYELVDNLGYEPMPGDAYQKWLQSVQEEKNKQEGDQLKLNLQQSLRKD
jgi:hypothetical protein